MRFLPSLSSILWTINSGLLLIFAFPDFEFSKLAFIALIPLFYSIEKEKDSKIKTFLTGWIWGIIFFFGSCWWLSHPMINYGGLPAPLAYLLVLGATSAAGLFPAIFALIQGSLFKWSGAWSILWAPFIWVFSEFLRYWITGNNWNAIGYSQAFSNYLSDVPAIAGVVGVSFLLVITNAFFFHAIVAESKYIRRNLFLRVIYAGFAIGLLILPIFNISIFQHLSPPSDQSEKSLLVIAIQPNVPMSGLSYDSWKSLRDRHVELAEKALDKNPNEFRDLKRLVIFPESPMNFEYARDAEMRRFFQDFAKRNNAKLIFNAGEPVYPQFVNREADTMTSEQIGKSLDSYNSAIMIDEKGELAAQYDKMHLLPFGEFIPLPKPIASLIPPVVGNFTHGKEYDLLDLGGVNAGIMICFESHFPSLSREYVKNGADAIIEITNDGYLGNTAVLRQHLANAIFRAMETNRPLLRVTNVGITSYIDERGLPMDPSEGFTEDSRIWRIGKSSGGQTFYVKYGDWFAWMCSLITLVVLFVGFWRRKDEA